MDSPFRDESNAWSAIRWLVLGRQRFLATNNFGNGWRAAPLLHVADEERGHPHFLKGVVR